MAMSENLQKRIFVVEQSAIGTGGHHLEYALRIAENSKFPQKHIVVSRKLKEDLKDYGFVIHPIYKYGYWDLPGKNIIKFLQKLLKQSKKNTNKGFKLPLALIKPLYLITTIRKPEVFVSIIQKNSNWPPKIPKFRLLFLALLTVIFTPLVLFLIAIRRLHHKRLKKTFISVKRISISIIKKILYVSLKIAYLYSLRKKYNQFFKDTSELLIKNKISKTDLLFFGTISLIEISALNRILIKRNSRPAIIIILRREPDEAGENSWNWQSVSRVAFSNGIKFFADTIELAESYSDLFGFKVDVFPIPAGDISNKELQKDKTYQISYLGDARSEKGFEDFVSLIIDNPELNVFAQINHSNTTDSKLSLALNSIQSSKANFAEKPMDSISYLAKISDSELIWIGYLGKNYEKRSSGIFIEATIRGIPSLVTDNSWMHAELYRNSFNYWQQEIVSMHVDWLNARRGVVKFRTTPLKKVTFNFSLSTGINLNSTAWSNSDGVLFLVLPLLHESESFCSVEQLETNFKLEYLGFSYFYAKPLWHGGIVLNNSERAQLAIKEFQTNKALYSQFEGEISPFLEFHSNRTLSDILENVTK